MQASQLREKARAWLESDPDAQTVGELKRLLDSGNLEELAERFSGPLEFGTAGLRGVVGAGESRMNRAVVRRTTAGLARYLKATVPDVRERGVVVGCDARHMSAEFAEDTAGVLLAEGIAVWFFETPVPTPLVAYATLARGVAAGVMVTASHNPPEYNGFKVYWGNGAQIVPPHDRGIASAIEKIGPARDIAVLPLDAARKNGLLRPLGKALEEAYLQEVLKARPYGRSGSLKVVYSALHGVGGRFVVEAMSQAGVQLEVVASQQAPDGRFPTVRFPNPEEPGAMDESVALAKKVSADVVLANDPDADRLAVMVKGPGGLVALSGNEVGVLLGYYVLTQARPLPDKPLVISTIVSSAQLGHIARSLGARYEETLTGFKWIANKAIECEAQGASFLFGYEEALGYTVGTFTRDKDGIASAVLFADLAAFCQSQGKTVLAYLEEIQRKFGLFVSTQANFTFPGAQGAEVIKKIMEGFRQAPPVRIGEYSVLAQNDYRTRERRENGFTVPLTLPSSNVLSYELEGGSRVTLRPSGTEPKIKYYFEMRHAPMAQQTMEEARQVAQHKLEVLSSAFVTLAKARGQP